MQGLFPNFKETLMRALATFLVIGGGLVAAGLQRVFMGRGVKDLFGHTVPWNVSQWVPINDQVRGGSSTSSLTSLEDGRRVLFHGHLDTTTLGGAGFASQRTIPGLNWNLGGKQGLLLRISNADGMRYSLNLKTEESGTSSAVEYKFFFDTLMNQSTEFEIPWSKFVPFFRGREQNNAPALDPSNIQSMSIMCASGFDTQKGDYALTVESISVY